MATTQTAAERGRANRRKGTTTEQAVARYLRAEGFPDARRAVHNGWRTAEHAAPDPLDIAGIPGVVISVKNDQSNQIRKWLDEAERTGNNHGAALALLVVRQRGKADVSRWWVWVSLAALAHALYGPDPSSRPPLSGYARMEIGEFVPMLHQAVYPESGSR